MYTYKVTQQDRAVVEEFLNNPIGHHSPALQRVLNRFRGDGPKDKYVLICSKRKPHREWTLAQLTGIPGKPPIVFADQIFTDLIEAEREVFRRRWKAYTDTDID